jgi:hypothetical protein
MDVLLTLPPETTIRPGHTDPTSVADELESNRFVRIWRGRDPLGLDVFSTQLLQKKVLTP